MKYRGCVIKRLKRSGLWAVYSRGQNLYEAESLESAKNWVDRFAGTPTRGNRARKNPTKAQKREKARKASVQRRVASALAKFLKQANPAMKTAGATVTRLKGGGFTIRPIKANPADGKYGVFENAQGDWYIARVYDGSHSRPTNFGSWNTFRTRAQAVAAAKRANGTRRRTR